MEMLSMREGEKEIRSRTYYDSTNADTFYRKVWDDEHIHIGIFRDYREPMKDACIRTVRTMAEEAGGINEETSILDVGSGNGATDRLLAEKYGCHIYGLNISEVQNARAESMNREQHLARYIDIVEGNFEEIPFDNESVDICWSIDAIMHSEHREKVIEEMSRVMREGGDLVFTDPMMKVDCPEVVKKPILERLHLSDMASLDFYREAAEKHGLEEVRFVDHSRDLVNTYSRLLEYTEENRDDLEREIEPGFLEHMEKGLKRWVDAGDMGYLQWGIMHFRKK